MRLMEECFVHIMDGNVCMETCEQSHTILYLRHVFKDALSATKKIRIDVRDLLLHTMVLVLVNI